MLFTCHPGITKVLLELLCIWWIAFASFFLLKLTLPLVYHLFTFPKWFVLCKCLLTNKTIQVQQSRIIRKRERIKEFIESWSDASVFKIKITWWWALRGLGMGMVKLPHYRIKWQMYSKGVFNPKSSEIGVF